MKLKSEGYKSTPINGVMKYVGILMALIYVTAGIAVLIGPGERINISSQYSVLLGGLLIAYGLFRGYKTYQNIVKNQ